MATTFTTYEKMIDLPLDPIASRQFLWERQFRASRGLGLHDIISKTECVVWLSALHRSISSTDFPYARPFDQLLLCQMGASAYGKLDVGKRKQAATMTGADALCMAVKELTTGEGAPAAADAEPLFEGLAALVAGACDCPSPPKKVPTSNRFAPPRIARRRRAIS